MALDPLTAGFELGGKMLDRNTPLIYNNHMLDCEYMKLKTCSACHLNKPVGEFAIDTVKRDGRHGRCKQCVRDYNKKYNSENAAKIRELDKIRYKKERVRRIQYSCRYSKANREALQAKTIIRNEKNRDRINAYFREYYEKNKLKLRGLKSMYASARRCKLIERIPKWANQSKIEKIYEECARMNLNAGYVKYHVDHEIPLVGKTVSGLHFEGNLQIITASENYRKHNKYMAI